LEGIAHKQIGRDNKKSLVQMAIFFYQLQGLNFEFKKKLETWSAFLKYIMGNERNLSTLVVEYQYLRFLVRTYHCWILKEVTTYKSST